MDKRMGLNRHITGEPSMAETPSNRREMLFVWSIWLIMMLAALGCLFKYGRNIPITEDWHLVPPITGNEPNLFSWLWSQNNEHRVLLPRLILLGVLKASHGDFRAGMVLTVIVFGMLSLTMVLVARSLRGGRTSYADAFFPITLLHLGNWENLFWSWQFTFVLAPVLSAVILLVLVSRQALAAPKGAAIAGICLMLLPLCGANGLLIVPLLAFWFFYCGVRHWSHATKGDRQRWSGAFLIGSAIVALCLTGLYFVGYERPSWTPPNPGFGKSLQAAIQFMALSFGPAARSSWTLSMFAAIAVLLLCAGLLVLNAIRHRDLERYRALGILVFFGSIGFLALAFGWGRAEWLYFEGWPIRYVILPAPALLAAFFVWELYGAKRARAIIQGALFLGMTLLIPLNAIHGFWWNDWYKEGMDAVEKDLAQGIPHSIFVERHRKFLHHSMEPNVISDHIRMLREAGIGPFAELREDPAPPKHSNSNVAAITISKLVSRTIRYHMPEAGEVFLVWGINGWLATPSGIQPAGTKIINANMHTPMIHADGGFVVELRIPTGSTLEYGFLITRTRSGKEIKAWDDGPNQSSPTNISEDGVVDVQARFTLPEDQVPVILVDAPLVDLKIRYHMPEAGEVFLVWGINGWLAAPRDFRPAGTKIRNSIMHSPMVREGENFVAWIQAPTGAKIDFGFMITKKRGIFDIIRPAWDGDQSYHFIAAGGVHDVGTKFTLHSEAMPASISRPLLSMLIALSTVLVLSPIYIARKAHL